MPADLDDHGAHQRAERDGETRERDIRRVARPVEHADRLRGGGGVLRAADERQRVAAMQLRARQDRNLRFRRAALDPAKEHAARARQARKFLQRLAVHFLARHEDIDAFRRHRQQLRILHLEAFRPEQLDEVLAASRDCDDVARLNHVLEFCVLHRARRA